MAKQLFPKSFIDNTQNDIMTGALIEAQLLFDFKANSNLSNGKLKII